MIELIGAPFDLCGHRYGSRLGPSALRLAGLPDSLRALGIEVTDSGDIPLLPEEFDAAGIKHFMEAHDACLKLKSAVSSALNADRLPIVVAGDHSLSIGSIASALERFGDGLALLWIDAHSDVNTPAQSPSGNLHGMPLAAIMGLASNLDPGSDAQWREFQSGVLSNRTLKPNRLGYLGLRSVDPGEQENIAKFEGAFITTMQDVDRFGMERVIQGLDRWLRDTHADALWISFDVDVLDPVLAPGTGTTVRGGLTYREAHLCGELLRDAFSTPGCPYRLVGLDLVETNPLFDTNNETARMVVEWVASLFGKSILHKARSSPL